MEDKQLNPEQSVALIQQMISQTRRRVERNAGIPFIVMGYLTAAVSLAVWYAFTQTHNNNWQYLWFIIPGVAIVCNIFIYRKEREKQVKTYIDRVMGYIWVTMGVTGFALSMLSIFIQVPILYIIVLLMGLGTALTGLVIRSKTVAVAGFVSVFILSPLFLFIQGIDQCLIFAAVFVVMMVIPGHIINYQSNHSEK